MQDFSSQIISEVSPKFSEIQLQASSVQEEKKQRKKWLEKAREERLSRLENYKYNFLEY